MDRYFFGKLINYAGVGTNTGSQLERAHGEMFSKSYYIKPESDCINHFLVDLEQNGRPFGSKSIEKW